MLRDWTDSTKFDGISADAERLFIRLIMKADDYGRFHADPRLIKAACFPLIDNLRPPDIARWLDELSTRQLILRYEADGRSIAVVVNYGQRLKSSRAKFPPMEGESADWLPTSDYFQHLPATSGKFPPEEKGIEVEDEGKGRECTPKDDWDSHPEKIPKPLCTLEQAKTYAPNCKMTATQAEHWWHTRNASGWTKGSTGGGTARRITSWQSDMATSLSWVGESLEKTKHAGSNGKKREFSSNDVGI